MEDTINYRGYEIEIKRDDYPLNPRTDWDNPTRMICFHSRYNLGDEHSYEGGALSEVLKQIEEKEGKVFASLPLYLYDHSGITMSTGAFSCRFDSGCVGVIVVTEASLKVTHGEEGVKDALSGKLTVEELEKWMNSCVKTYDQYLTGDVYSYNIEEVDSCSGFFGDEHKESGLLENAENAIDCHIQYKAEEHAEKVKNWIKSKVSLIYRTEFELV